MKQDEIQCCLMFGGNKTESLENSDYKLLTFKKDKERSRSVIAALLCNFGFFDGKDVEAMKMWFKIRNEAEDIIMQIEQEMIIFDNEFVSEVSEDMEFVKS
jgi:hypothetical protein